MTDLAKICPGFLHDSFTTSVLLSIEAANLTVADILSLSAEALSKQTGKPTVAIRKFCDYLVKQIKPAEPIQLLATNTGTPNFITTGDDKLDEALGGKGIPTGSITEIAGSSGTGKSQALIQLCVTTQLSPRNGGLAKSAVYISTESGLETRRLNELLHHFKKKFPAEAQNLRTDNILCITCSDLEFQQHIIRYQLPVLVRKHKIGLIVIDSIANHFRVEYSDGGKISLHKRGNELVLDAFILRSLAVENCCAVVVSNQVRDQFINFEAIAATLHPSLDIFSLDYQSRFFSGWDWLIPNEDMQQPKLPALGLIWTNCISTRIVLKRLSILRTIEVVFSPYTSCGRPLQFEISDNGIHGIEYLK
ncbi:DNA repair protein-like protein rhp57 [Dipodascopsis uninucleata]